MKKRLMLLMVLAASILLTACGSQTGGEDSSHPYSWKEKSNGEVRLTIENAPDEGYSWQFDGDESGLIQVERTDSGTGNKAVFSITGQEENAAGIVRLSCSRDTAPFDASFQLTLTLDTSDKGKLQVTSAEYTQTEFADSVGEEGKAECVWYQGDNGTLNVYLKSEDQAYTWSAMGADGSLVTVSEPAYDETGCAYCLTGLAAGDTELVLYDLQQDYGFRLTLKVDDDNVVSVANGEAGTFTIAADQIPGMTDGTALVGELTLPEEARVLRCEVAAGSADDSTAVRNYVQLTLQLNKKDWDLLVTKTYTREELIALCGGKGATQNPMTVGGESAVLCTIDFVPTLFWTDAQGRSFAFGACSAMDTTQQDLSTAAESLCTALKGEA